MRVKNAKRMAAVLLLAAVWPAFAERQKNQTPSGSPPDVALNQYIARVRAEKAAETLTPGSIWSPTGRLTNLVSDVKAVRAHDPIAVVVYESLTASTDGTVKNQRASTAAPTRPR
jgi:flagellar L-ring protein FlgH